MVCQPPKIISVERSPETPNYNQPITITAKVIPMDVEVESVILKYKTYSIDWIEVNMNLEDPEDCIYVAEIPAYPYNTQIIYKVYAYDINDHYSFSEYYCHAVCDFVSPVISNIHQVPSSPLPYETATVSATVTEPPEGSGVKNVTLCYSTNDEWLPLEMNKQKGVWSANIPVQNEGVTVRFFVKAFDKKGNRAASSILDYTVVMPNSAPVSDFTESAEIVYVDDVINFNAASSHDPDGTIVSYYWDFGDGNTGLGVSISHSYTESGTYIVTLIVTDDDRATDTVNAAKGVLIRTVQPRNQGPSASFTESAETVYTGENIFFDASDSSDPDGTIISFLWNFGDGNTAVGVETNHAYGDDDTYTVTLTIIDNDGATDSTASTKNVRNRPPTVSFTENATTVKTGETIHFDASHSSDPDGTIVEYFWDFGDEANATGVTPTHAYSEDGSYSVTLTVTDDDGASSSESASKFVKTEEKLDIALSLSFIGAAALGMTAFTVTLLYGLLIRRRRQRIT